MRIVYHKNPMNAHSEDIPGDSGNRVEAVPQKSKNCRNRRIDAEEAIPEDGGRYWTRTSDPYRVKVVL